VTLVINGGGDLLGTLTRAAVNGTATFSGLSVTRAGTGYTISATSNGISVASSSFSVTPASANAGQSSATYTPATVTTGATIAVVFAFKDQFGNPLPNKTVTLSSNLAGVTFTPSSGTTSATGTFTTNMVATAAGSATVSATVDGAAISLPTAVTITAPVTITITTSSNPANGGTTSGGGTKTQGASVTVVATPASGFLFTNWTEGTAVVSTSASFTFTASVSRTLVANFSSSSSGDCSATAMAFPGTATGSLPAAGACVANGLSAANFRFTATGAGAVTMNLTSAFSGQLEVKTDPTPGDNHVLTGTSPIAGEWLLPAGSYQARVSAVTGTGTFTLTSTATAGNSNNGSGCTAGVPRRVLLVGGTYTGQSLGTGDCALSDGTRVDIFSIKSLKPCTITMASGTSLDPYIIIGNAEFTSSLAEKDDFGPGVTETISLTACNNGGSAITIGMNTFAPSETGAYTMTITITGGGSLMAGDVEVFTPSTLPVTSISDLFRRKSQHKK
jgi:hypothetical protein